MPTIYETSDGETVTIPDKMNPFDVLGIDPSATPGDTKTALKKGLTKSSTQDRASASLAYHMITSPGKYFKRGNTYERKGEDIFVFAAMGYRKGVAAMITKNTCIVNSVDDCKRTPLYLAARGGFRDLAELLIHKGADVNAKQKENSTPLHAAAYYGQIHIVTMLLVHGADPTLKNNFDHTPYDESSKSIEREIEDFKKDRMASAVKHFSSSSLTGAKRKIVFRGKVIGFEIFRNKSALDEYTKFTYDTIKIKWKVAYHGTRLKHVKSILTNGLLPTGAKLPSGETITPPPGHIGTDKTFQGVDNWAKAIFVTPSVMYATHPAYSEYSGRGDSQLCVVLKVYVHPSKHEEYSSTASPAEPLIDGEPKNLEYRIAETSELGQLSLDPYTSHRSFIESYKVWIWRIIGSSYEEAEAQRHVVVGSILLIDLNFRQNVKKYGLTFEDLKKMF